MRPEAGRTKPLMVRSKVVLPAPLAPRTAVMVPGAACKETPSRARTAPYVVTTSSTVSPSAVGTAHLPGLVVDVLAEVGLEHLGVVLHLVRCAARDDAPEVEHHDAVTHLHDEVHVVLDQQDRHPFAQVADELSELCHLVAGQSRCGFVQQ